MMRGCAWLLGLTVLIVLIVAIIGANLPNTPPPAPTIDLARPVYLAKDAVECSEVTILGTYMDGQQAGGEAEGHRRVRDLFVHPKHGCARTIGRERIHVLDKTISADKFVDIECHIAERGNRCSVLPSDLGN
jgi:hypothetical protein